MHPDSPVPPDKFLHLSADKDQMIFQKEYAYHFGLTHIFPYTGYDQSQSMALRTYIGDWNDKISQLLVHVWLASGNNTSPKAGG